MTDHPPSGTIRDRAHRFPLRVYFEDTDAGGIVYNASYLRFAERGRTEMLRLAGFDHRTLMRDRGLALAVRRLEIDFLRPARLDDALCVRTRVTRAGGASMILDQSIERDGEAVCGLTVTLVCMALQGGRATRIPLDVRAALETFLATE